MNRRLIGLAGLLTLASLLSGCRMLEQKAVAGNIDGAILRINPSTTELMVGEGTFTWVDCPIKAGQSFEFASSQYDIRSTNLWYSSKFRVDAAIDGTAMVETGPAPFLQVFGLSLYVPWSSRITTLRYVPNATTNGVGR